MVFDEKVFTLTQLSNFLKANWEGYEAQRSYILNNGRYFGNDDDYVDLLINKVAESVNKFSEMYTPYRTGRYLFGTLTGYELSHLRFGKITGASPDGRYSGDPFSASIATFPGADKNGMTAYLKSAAKLDETLIQSSVVVNLKLDRAFADTEKKKERLASVLQTYFDLGGIQLQTIYVSPDELIKAQKEPERYQTLRVRVTGFSGFFTSFDKALQDEIIKRYLHTN
jgi:formate C-acetyltransferase